MKRLLPLLCLCVCSGAVVAEQPDTCAELNGTALNQCLSNQQTIKQQQRLEQLLQQQQERQTQLDEQQRQVRQELETMRLQNESLRKQLEHEIANPPARAAAVSSASPTTSADVTSWKADNPWFGTDYAKTQFAMRSIKQLQQDRPDLSGRKLLDELSAKVNQTFGANH